MLNFGLAIWRLVDWRFKMTLQLCTFHKSWWTIFSVMLKCCWRIFFVMSFRCCRIQMPDSTVSIYDDDEIKKKQFHFFGEIGLNCFFLPKILLHFLRSSFCCFIWTGEKERDRWRVNKFELQTKKKVGKHHKVYI